MISLKQMNPFLVVLLNSIVLASWIYMLYQVYTIDPEVQQEWEGVVPSWAPNYKSMIFSIKVTAFINGSVAFLSLLSGIYGILSLTYQKVRGPRVL